MSSAIPLRYLGEGQFQATHGHSKRLDKELTIGEVLTWGEVKGRSKTSHDHFFAQIDDSWATLPEHLAMDFPNATSLRKFALIKTGFCTMHRAVCRDNREAIATAAIFASLEDYTICEISGAVVTVWKPESQKVKAMGGKRFQESKTACLDFISQLIGADAAKAGMAA